MSDAGGPSRAGHDAGSVLKGLPLLGDGPDVYVVFDSVPAEGRVSPCCLTKQAIILQAVLPAGDG